MDYETISVIVSSGDHSATGSASHFTCPIAIPLSFEGKWQCRVMNISFPNPNASGDTTSNSVFVFGSGLIESSSVGSSTLPVLFRVPPLDKENHSVNLYVADLSPSPLWHDVIVSLVSQIDIQIVESTGGAIPDGFSTVQLVFRRIA